MRTKKKKRRVNAECLINPNLPSYPCLSHLGDSKHLSNGNRLGDLLASDSLGRVRLSRLPVWVLVVLSVALELEAGSAFSSEPGAFLVAAPGLVNHQVTSGAVEGVGGGVVDILRVLARVDGGAVVEVLELG